MSSKPLKVVIVGPGAVGKTVSCMVLSGKDPPSDVLMTIGAQFHHHTLSVDGQEFRLQLWDLAGQDRFGQIRQMYYKGLKALVLMFDLTIPHSLDDAKKYLHEEIKSCIADQRIGCIAVVGNKRDLLDKIVITDEEVAELAAEVESTTGITTLHFTTSVYESDSIKEAFDALITCSLKSEG